MKLTGISKNVHSYVGFPLCFTATKPVILCRPITVLVFSAKSSRPHRIGVETASIPLFLSLFGAFARDYAPTQILPCLDFDCTCRQTSLSDSPWLEKGWDKAHIRKITVHTPRISFFFTPSQTRMTLSVFLLNPRNSKRAALGTQRRKKRKKLNVKSRKHLRCIKILFLGLHVTNKLTKKRKEITSTEQLSCQSTTGISKLLLMTYNPSQEFSPAITSLGTSTPQFH